MIASRKAAYDILTAITRDGAYTGLALKKHMNGDLSETDRRFASRLVRTTLENLIFIDYSLNKFITAKRVHGSIRNILRLGACQILFMDTKNFAAVSESVKLAKKIKPQMSGFVNAVLRNLLKNKDSIDYPNGDNAESFSVKYSYPVWICEKFIKDFGLEFTKELFSYSGSKATFVRDNILISGSLEEELNNQNLSYKKGEIENSYIISGLTNIEEQEIYKTGKLAVQSKSAMKAVLAAGIKPGDKLLDCCAAPGGKSAYAAALSGNGINILSWDIHEHRIDMTNKNYERLGVSNARAVEHDATVLEPCLKEKFDVVLVDAPCSAMGLMAKNPDIRYVRTMKDVKSLSGLQQEILSTCSSYVKAGGTLAYYTCSINREENENVTDAFLKNNKDFEYVNKPETLYPHIEDSDGFYIAIMRKKQ